jgi:hypothetical protein
VEKTETPVGQVAVLVEDVVGRRVIDPAYRDNRFVGGYIYILGLGYLLKEAR